MLSRLRANLSSAPRQAPRQNLGFRQVGHTCRCLRPGATSGPLTTLLSGVPWPGANARREGSVSDDDDNRRTGALAGLAIALALIVAGLFLVQYFRHENAVEDCLMAHRTDCDSLAR